MSHDEGRAPLPPHPTLDRYYADPAGQREFLDAMFEATAPHYGRLDGLVSFGSGPYYRRYALHRAGLEPGMVALDVATGTGLVAQAARALVGPTGRVTGLDRNAGMLAEARRTLGGGFVQGMAERLPFRGDHFDFLSMGYALRHVTDLDVTFAEGDHRDDEFSGVAERCVQEAAPCSSWSFRGRGRAWGSQWVASISSASCPGWPDGARGPARRRSS